MGEDTKEKETWSTLEKVLVGITLAVGIIAVGAISPIYNEHKNRRERKTAETINQKNHNAIGLENINIALPPQLVSYPDKNDIIDITSITDVANAMGIEITGEKDQVLFGVEINGKTLPITVEMLPKIAEAINATSFSLSGLKSR